MPLLYSADYTYLLCLYDTDDIRYTLPGNYIPGHKPNSGRLVRVTGTEENSQSQQEEDAQPNGRGHGKGVAITSRVHSPGTEERNPLKRTG